MTPDQQHAETLRQWWNEADPSPGYKALMAAIERAIELLEAPELDPFDAEDAAIQRIVRENKP